MASAIPSYPSTRETTNYARMCRLLVDAGRHVLSDVFDRIRPIGKLDVFLSNSAVHSTLASLKRRGALNPSQWAKLYPAIRSSASSTNFDITLLTLLLRNTCNLVPPSTGWNAFPPAADTSIVADIIRIKCYRNEVYGHAEKASFNDAVFIQYWQDIKEALVRLGGNHYETAIDELLNESMDPDVEEYYQELLKQWVTAELIIKESLDKVHKKLDQLKLSLESKQTVNHHHAPGSNAYYFGGDNSSFTFQNVGNPSRLFQAETGLPEPGRRIQDYSEENESVD